MTDKTNSFQHTEKQMEFKDSGHSQNPFGTPALSIFKEPTKAKNLTVKEIREPVLHTGMDFLSALDNSLKLSGGENQVPNEVAIYNKFDISSIIAAAVWKTMTGGLVLPSDTSVVPSGYRTIHWIGVKPKSAKKELSFFGFSLSRNKDKDVGFVYHDHGFKIIDEETNYDGRITLSHIKVPVTPLESMIHHLRIPEDRALNSLCHALTKFMDKDATEDEILTVFYHYEKAINTLALQDNFGFGFPNMTTKEKFVKFMRHVKTTLSQNYRGQLVSSGESGKFRYVLVTHISSEMYPWMKRLISLVHGNYLNSVDTANGRVVDTNLSNARSLMLDENHHYSNQFVM